VSQGHLCPSATVAYNAEPMLTLISQRLRAMLALCAAATFAGAAAAAYPPPVVELSPEHPFFVFADTASAGAGPGAYAAAVVQHWASLPEPLRPYSAMGLLLRPEDMAGVLTPLQQAAVPVVVRVADTASGVRWPLREIEAMVGAFTTVRGMEALGFTFDDYDPDTADDAGLQPRTRWLMQVMELSAGYGRVLLLPLDGIAAARLGANANTAPLYAKMRECRDHVAPVCLQRGGQTLPGTAALMGMWLEGAATNWGVAPDARWYREARFLEPGVFGGGADPARMPSGLYRAMILNGAMTGATVYQFPWDPDLWFGANTPAWSGAILPTLEQIVEGGFIARRDFAAKRAVVGLQLAPAATPLDFAANLREIDGVCNAGLLLHGAYGMERPAQVPELIPNRGDRYWVPILPAHAAPGALSGFAEVVRAGQFSAAAQWDEALSRRHPPEAGNAAFVTRVGRGVFVMNTRENVAEPQAFTLPDLPAPVRAITARREGSGVTVAWPFRESDVSYNVWRRVPPETHFALVARGLDQRQFTDAPPLNAESLAYSVTALTGEKEPLSGTVGYAESLVFSSVESRIAEEAQVTPVLAQAQSTALPGFGDEAARIHPPLPPLRDAQGGAVPWWPFYGGLDDGQRAVAQEVVARLEAMDTAFAAADLEGVMSVYAPAYEDAQGWDSDYARRAWQWFFEHCRGPRMHRQIRRWDFSGYGSEGMVSVLLYCRFTGAPLSDPAGRRAAGPVSLPREEPGEVWFTFMQADGAWRILRTQPALPNFRDLLSWSAGPGDGLVPGPDQYAPAK
jgi:hypothetical protein